MNSPRHNHFTRDVKPRGKCPACDLSWKLMDDAESAARSRREFADSCCGKCEGGCYVDQMTGA